MQKQNRWRSEETGNSTIIILLKQFVIIAFMKVNPGVRARELRKTLKLDDRILVAKFSDTLQGKDTSRVIDLMPNIATGELVFRTKVNIKEIDSIASKVYNTSYFDISQKTDTEIEDFVRKHEFDFPLWFKHNRGFSMKNIMDYNMPFVLQVAGCNFHDGSSTGGCWYCFVDDESNNGKPEGKAYLSVNETIDSMLAAKKKIKETYEKEGQAVDIRVLRTSGGEPTIVLDWILRLWQEIGRRGLDFNGQLDSNLSTGICEELYESNVLEKLAEYPIKVLAAIKGVDERNLQNNVQASANMRMQEYSLKRFIKAGFDVYPQVYNPNPRTLAKYLSKMDSIVENFSLKVHVSPIKIYGPTTQRLTLEAERLGGRAEDFIKQKSKEWKDNYQNACEVIDSYLRKTHGVGYKDTVRADVQLKIK
jgi:uncharacterized Fe-S cluster-containing radical SAM superfamily protein